MNEAITLRKKLVLYHAACRDGWAAAWAVHRAMLDDDVEFLAVYHGAPAPDVKDREVIMVDFCYPRDVMEHIAEDAESLLVLDHHATAQRALDGFADGANAVLGAGAVAVTFDMNRSGAGIAWDHFHPGVPRPWLIDYVEDRDLSRSKLPNSHEVNAYISVLPFDFKMWDSVNVNLPRVSAAHLGEVALAKSIQYVTQVTANAYVAEAWGHRVPCVNVPQVDVSEVHDYLLTKRFPDAKFSIAWWVRADGKFQYSLRSRSDFDVSELAKEQGGGGHAQAAGFELPFLAGCVIPADSKLRTAEVTPSP
jgi:hypothetical protein